MCVVSMVMDHYTDKWRRWVPTDDKAWPWPTVPPTLPGGDYVPYIPPPTPTPPSPLTQEEIDEFRKWIREAREYDRKNNQPDCELDEKKQLLEEIARKLGVEISFD